MTEPIRSSFGTGWLILCAAFAIHVIDEAATDFLSLYNPVAQRLREQLPLLPIPIFSFSAWLTGLIILIVVLLALTPMAWRGVRWLRPLAYAFAAIMLLNGIGHVLGSIYLARPMPGVYSSPLLLLASGYLIVSLSRSGRSDIGRDGCD